MCKMLQEKQSADQHLRDVFVVMSQKFKCDQVQVLRWSSRVGRLAYSYLRSRDSLLSLLCSMFFPSFNQAA